MNISWSRCPIHAVFFLLCSAHQELHFKKKFIKIWSLDHEIIILNQIKSSDQISQIRLDQVKLGQVRLSQLTLVLQSADDPSSVIQIRWIRLVKDIRKDGYCIIRIS
jgi:hypothetical protein